MIDEFQAMGLDDTQALVAGRFLDHACTIDLTAEIRRSQCESTLLILDRKTRVKFATLMHANIRKFGTLCRDVSGNVLNISASTGTIHPDKAPEYLAQEQRRQQYLDKMTQWMLSNATLRGSHPNVCNDTRLPDTEMMVFLMASNELHIDLSSLTDDEELQRALLILKEIHKNRPRFGSAFLAPLSIGRELSAAVIAGVAAVGSIWGAGPGVAGAGAQVIERSIANSRKAKSLKVPEADAITIVKARLKKRYGRPDVLHCMTEIGISSTVEDLLRMTEEEMFSTEPSAL